MYLGEIKRMKNKYKIKDREWFEDTGIDLRYFDDEFNSYVGTIQDGSVEAGGNLLIGNSYFHADEYEEVTEDGEDPTSATFLTTGSTALYTPLNSTTEFTDKHYNFNAKLTSQEIESVEIRLDPYRVAKEWRLGKKDDTGCLFHILKGIARFGDKNSVEREIKAMEATIKRMKELLLDK